MKYGSAVSFFAFNIDQQYFIFNTARISIYRVPAIIYDIACIWDPHSPENIVDRLGNRYPAEDLKKSIDAINKLDLLNGSPGLTSISTEPNPPKQEHLQELYLQISHDCNLRCSYCYAAGGSFGGPALKMDEVTAKKAVDFFLEQLPSHSAGFINFDGGEPFLNWSLIEKVVADAIPKARSMQKKIQFKIGTNGTLLNDHNIKLLKSGIFSLGISIDGGKDVHDACRKFPDLKGSYYLVEKNFNTYKESLAGCTVQARATITKANLKVTGIVKQLIDMGFKHIYFEPVSSKDPLFNLSGADYNIIKEECSALAKFYTDALLEGKSYTLTNFIMYIKRLHAKKKHLYKCEVARTGAAITPKGEIFPCYKFANLDGFCIGQVKNSSPSGTALNSHIQEQFLENKVDNRPGCRDCWARYLCGGGCAYLGFLHHHDIKRKDENECAFTLHMIILSLQIYLTVKNKIPHFWTDYFK